jgi:hypothetical protein
VEEAGEAVHICSNSDTEIKGTLRGDAQTLVRRLGGCAVSQNENNFVPADTGTMDRAGEEIDKEMKSNEHRSELYEELERKIKSSEGPNEWESKLRRRPNGLRDQIEWEMTSSGGFRGAGSDRRDRATDATG